MTFRVIGGTRLAELTKGQVADLTAVPVDEFTVSEEAIEEYKKQLEITEETSDEDLQSIRNGVVFALATQSSIYRNQQDRRYWDVQKTMSAITTVIDDIKWKRGMAV